MRLVAFAGLAGVLVARGALAQSEPGGAVVHLDGNAPRAEVQALDDDDWKTVCVQPCRRALDPRFEYRIGGEGLLATGTFRVPPDGHVFLTADMRPRRNLRLGVGLTVGGGFALAGGIGLWALGVYMDQVAANAVDGGAYGGSGALFLLGTVFGVAGLAMVLPGIVFLSRTRSTVESSRDVAFVRSGRLQIVPGGFAF